MPIAPAPTTTASLISFEIFSSIHKRSSSVLNPVTPSSSIPGMGGIKGIVPVAIINFSKEINHTLESYKSLFNFRSHFIKFKIHHVNL